MERGDAAAREEFVRRVYPELHKLAAQCIEKGGAHTSLEPSVLLHEAWIRVNTRAGASFAHRGAFLAFASKVMRSVLVDHARAAAAMRRGGGQRRISQVLELVPREAREVDLLGLEEALEQLAEIDPVCVELVELRFFGGLTHAAIAETLHTSLRQVERKWRFARAWLHSALSEG